MESVISALVIVLVIRSRRPFFESIPGRYLSVATLLTVAITLIFPLTPLAKLFGFRPLPSLFLLVLGVIIVIYTITAEITKRVFYKKVRF
ncbi:MAG: hypothetical protein C4291_11180 [Candidatus Dadabacteria bacterium]